MSERTSGLTPGERAKLNKTKKLGRNQSIGNGPLKNNEEQISRRNFLEKGLGLAALIATGAGAYSLFERMGKDESLSMMSVDSKLKDLLEKKGFYGDLESSVKKYSDRYGKPPQEIKFLLNDLSSGDKKIPGGGKIIVLEEASPGIITFDKNNLFEADRDSFENTALHSLSHAYVEKQTILFEKMTLPDSRNEIYGFEGLNLLIKTEEGKKTKFTKIAEGVCEALAKHIKDDYTVRSRSYYGVGDLTLDLIKTGYFTDQELSNINIKSDMLRFVSRLTNSTQPGIYEIQQTMDWYQRAFDSKDNLELDIIKKEIDDRQIPKIQ